MGKLLARALQVQCFPQVISSHNLLMLLSGIISMLSLVHLAQKSPIRVISRILSSSSPHPARAPYTRKTTTIARAPPLMLKLSTKLEASMAKDLTCSLEITNRGAN